MEESILMGEPVVDQATYAALRDAVGADFIVELIDTYCEETPTLIAQAQKALEDGNAEVFRRAAHSIKSSSASLGAMPFSALARELEILGKGGNLSGAGAGVARLVVDYGGVERKLRELQDGA
jgi:histidine phosphotransfer protein HptB